MAEGASPAASSSSDGARFAEGASSAASATTHMDTNKSSSFHLSRRLQVYPLHMDAKNQAQYHKLCKDCEEQGIFLPRDKQCVSSGRKGLVQCPFNDNHWVGNLDKHVKKCPDRDKAPTASDSSLARPVLPKHKALPQDADTDQWELRMPLLSMGSTFRGMGAMLARRAGSFPVAEEVLTMIQSNRSDPRISSLFASRGGVATAFTLRVTLLEMTLDFYRVLSRIPAALPLRALQDRILCSLFEWDRDFPKQYAFYLPSSAYPSGKRPLDHESDICFLPRERFDVWAACDAGDKFISEAQPVDDSQVCLADLLQDQGHILYYRHNRMCPINFSIELVGLEQIDDVGQSDITVSGGYGMNPPEHMLTETNDEEEVWGAQAFCLALKYLGRPSDSGWPQEGKRILGLHNSVSLPFDHTAFDTHAAQRRVSESTSKGKVKRCQFPVTTFDVMTAMHNPTGMAAQQLRGCGRLLRGRCGSCGTDNTKLLCCGACANAWYCSKTCQKLDWRAHKKVCVKMQ
eukprot:TRINITY_DN68203_c0_g1_i1.p1 TRINITY_DN68203_c0_g1~~TRINITY_DN68203_c0_g1_i1.p1  ORF type:complete len:539 (-),score=57.03 TRINITY_DN68203_c0_g1_i1:524-2071(-)